VPVSQARSRSDKLYFFWFLISAAAKLGLSIPFAWFLQLFSVNKAPNHVLTKSSATLFTRRPNNEVLSMNQSCASRFHFANLKQFFRASNSAMFGFHTCWERIAAKEGTRRGARLALTHAIYADLDQ